MQPQLHHCWQSSGLSYTAWHMNSQRPLKKKEVLKGNTSNLSMTDPMSVKPVVSAEGVPCQTSQSGLVSQACIIGEGCSPQARWQWTEVLSHNTDIYIVIKIWFLYYSIWEISILCFQNIFNILMVCCVLPDHYVWNIIQL